MSYAPFSAALESRPGIPGSRRGPIQLGMLSTDSDPDALIAMLSRALVNRTVTTDIILGAIAEAAQALTNAGGAALAVQSELAYVCRARSGEMAPNLGAQLKLDSGISGECLRTGNLLRCDDTQNDYRVDAEVCFRMGIRSIAVTPLRGRRGPIGILEVFSSRAYAFTQEHTEFLNRLAVIAEAAQEPTVTSAAALTPQASPSLVQEEKAAEETLEGTTSPKIAEAEAVPARSNLWKIALSAAAVFILLATGYFTLGSRFAKSAPAATTTTLTAAQPEPVAAPANTAPATDAGALTWRAPAPPKPSPAVKASAAVKVQPAKTARSSVADSRSTGGPLRTPTPGASANPTTAMNVPPPVLSPGTGDAPALGSLLPNQPALPKFAAPVSKGVTEAVIEHRVQPVYPQQALAMRLEGQVVLLATVSEHGKVESVKVLSGNGILAEAGMNAVRQWRYRPFMLDGKPIRMQTQVTLKFKAP